MRCRFKSKIFYNETNGYTIAAYWTEDTSVPLAVQNKSSQGPYSITAIGYDLPMNDKVEVELEGNWVQNAQYGVQYQVESHMEVIPRTEEGIVGYLSSGAIKGIGIKMAQAIFSRFGMDTLEVIEHTPEKLLAIRGISEKKLEEITESFQKNQTFRELMIFLAPFQVSPKKVQKILLEFGSDALQIIRQRPYRLCAIKGFGFLTVDEIAKKCNGMLNDPIRISGCISYVLKQAQQEGHLYLPKDTLLSQVMEFLNRKLPQPAVSEREVQEVLYRLVLQKNIVAEDGLIYPADLYEMEAETARMVVRHILDTLPVHNVGELIQEAQTMLGITLSASQAQAVQMVFSNPISIITGGPGTGKTTVLKVILYVHKKLEKGEVQLMAPTGRAARRMTESTGEVNASTMHMAFGLVGDESYEEFSYLEARFINVDEFSMVDMRLAYEFFRRLTKGTRIILIGDIDQLPSVGPGDVFRHLIQCGRIPVTVLDLAYRQAEHIRIYQNAQRIKKNEGKLSYGADFQFIESSGAEHTAELVLKSYRQELGTLNADDVQILTPYRSRGAASVNELNKVLREIVNPAVSGIQEMKVGNRTFREGDKILQTKNTAIISNGDMGTIQNFFVDQEGESKAKLLFSDQRVVIYGAEQMEDIELAYATTVHKSQGSEYPVVILPWIKGFYTMLKRAILYTAVTRAKAKVILVGERAALYQAIHTDDSGKRNTRLSDRIQREYERLALPEEKKDFEQLKLVI